MVCSGKSVTLRSLFPGTIVTVRVSGFQPVPGMRTMTTWSPSARLTFIGVTFPVSTPSTITWAPDGKDVTFNVPAAAGAAPITNAATAMITLVIGVRSEIPRLPRIVSSSQQVLFQGARENRLRHPAHPHVGSQARS
jgi:hypothetical protein